MKDILLIITSLGCVLLSLRCILMWLSLRHERAEHAATKTALHNATVAIFDLNLMKKD